MLIYGLNTDTQKNKSIQVLIQILLHDGLSNSRESEIEKHLKGNTLRNTTTTMLYSGESLTEKQFTKLDNDSLRLQNISCCDFIQWI